jgi:hypothetical protein
MGIDLFSLVLVQANEPVQDIVASRSVIISTLVIWEIVLHWADRELLLKSVNLVQEENYRCLDEPSRVANGVKQRKSFLHSVNSLVFEKQLIVFGYGD